MSCAERIVNRNRCGELVADVGGRVEIGCQLDVCSAGRRTDGPRSELQRSETAAVVDNAIDGRIAQNLLSADGNEEVVELGEIARARVTDHSAGILHDKKNRNLERRRRWQRPWRSRYLA